VTVDCLMFIFFYFVVFMFSFFLLKMKELKIVSKKGNIRTVSRVGFTNGGKSTNLCSKIVS
jgi:hypothetical protein